MSNHRIKEIIKEKGTTIDAIAKKIGVQPSAISQSISGNPTMERLQQIADALGVHITDLFDREPENTITCPKCGAKLEIKEKTAK